MAIGGLVIVKDANTHKLKGIQNSNGDWLAEVNKHGNLEITVHGQMEGYVVRKGQLVVYKSRAPAY